MLTSAAPTTLDTQPPALAHEAFYTQLTSRNRGLISDLEQQAVREARILVAGCGSIGGAAVEPLVRLGAERLTLAEPDVYEAHNLNRQNARLCDVGTNKAIALAERMRCISPYVQITVDPTGITASNVAAHLAQAQLVFDGIDVTSRPPLRCKYLLHEAAHANHLPVVSGYDIAGTQLVLVYDYRKPAMTVLDGRFSGAPVADLNPLQFLARVVPMRALPVEIFPELRRQLSGQSDAFPQLVYPAQLFGVLAARLAVELLCDRPVRRRIVLDVHSLTRPAAQQWRTRAVRLRELLAMARIARRYRQASAGDGHQR
jgi:hypothetical protein